MLRLKIDADMELLSELGFDLDSCDNYALYLRKDVEDELNPGEVLYIELATGDIVYVTGEKPGYKGLEILYDMIINNMIERV